MAKHAGIIPDGKTCGFQFWHWRSQPRGCSVGIHASQSACLLVREEDKLMSAALHGFLFPWSQPSLPLLFPVPLPRRNFALIIFTWRISFSGFSLWPSQCVLAITEHKLTQMQCPNMTPSMTEMETHHHLPPRRLCSAGLARCSVIPHLPCFCLVFQEHQAAGGLVNLPGRDCLCLSATIPSPLTPFSFRLPGQLTSIDTHTHTCNFKSIVILQSQEEKPLILRAHTPCQVLCRHHMECSQQFCEAATVTISPTLQRRTLRFNKNRNKLLRSNQLTPASPQILILVSIFLIPPKYVSLFCRNWLNVKKVEEKQEKVEGEEKEICVCVCEFVYKKLRKECWNKICYSQCSIRTL